MAERTYRFLRSENDSPPLLGDDRMQADEAWALLTLDELMIRIAGFKTRRCRCAQGFHAWTLGADGQVTQRRQVHIVEDEGEGEVLDLRAPVFAVEES